MIGFVKNACLDVYVLKKTTILPIIIVLFADLKPTQVNSRWSSAWVNSR